MNLVDVLRADYARFPANQTYSIYAKDVWFKDPMNEFRGVDRYRKMIQFIETWFVNVQMDLISIAQTENEIKTRWVLSWNAPLPWKPRMSIPGWSELQVNSDGLISAHVDYWECSRLDVLKQVFHS
jgi:hypothetical protein